MVEKFQDFMKNLGETDLLVAQYKGTFLTLHDLFPKDPKITCIKGHVVMTGMTRIDNSKIIKDVDTTVTIDRTEPGSDLDISVGIEVAHGNFIAVSKITLPGLKSARPDDMRKAANDDVLQTIVSQIQSFGKERNSFMPNPRKS